MTHAPPIGNETINSILYSDISLLLVRQEIDRVTYRLTEFCHILSLSDFFFVHRTQTRLLMLFASKNLFTKKLKKPEKKQKKPSQTCFEKQCQNKSNLRRHRIAPILGNHKHAEVCSSQVVELNFSNASKPLTKRIFLLVLGR